jgi:hypothetical protein
VCEIHGEAIARRLRITPPVLSGVGGAPAGHMTGGLGSRDVHVNPFSGLSVHLIKRGL